MSRAGQFVGGPLHRERAPSYAEDVYVHIERGQIPHRYERVEHDGGVYFVLASLNPVARIAALRRAHAERAGPYYASESSVAEVLDDARRLVKRAAEVGVVVTITQRPLQPLAMGHYETVAEVRPVRL